MNHKISIFTQYGQFYLADKEVCGDTSGTHFWNDLAFNERLAITEGCLGVLVENDEAIANIEIEILSRRNENFDLNLYDHIVEGSLYIGSGILQILDCPNWEVVLELKVDPSWYRVRIYSMNLNLAYQVEPEDSYRIEVWEEKESNRNILKNWKGSQ